MSSTLIDFSTLFSNLSRAKVADIVDQWFPPKPTYTEASVPRQDGRVFIITGGNSGIGLALTKLLYPKGAKIYLACRSEERAQAAINEVIEEYKTASNDVAQDGPPGSIVYMHLDLNDLSTIKASAASFAEKEARLDVLWNNAGIAGSPVGTKTKQGIEGHIGVNCVGPLLFTKEVLPQLRNAASSSFSPGATRVVWTSSIIIERFAPEDGVDLANLDRINAAGTGSELASREYAASKAGNWLLGVEGARRWGTESEAGKADGIVSVTQNPGMISTPVWKHQPGWMMAFMNPTFYPPKMGAYAMLFAGLSDEIGIENNGAYILPFGRIQQKSTNAGILKAIEDGKAKDFWEWCERLHTLS